MKVNRDNLDLAVYEFKLLTVGLTVLSIVALIPNLVFNIGLNPFHMVLEGFVIGLTMGTWLFIMELLIN